MNDEREILANAITFYCVIYKKEKKFYKKADELKAINKQIEELGWYKL